MRILVHNRHVPATLVPNNQLWFQHPEMQARVARSEADFAAGRAELTKSPEDAQTLLDRLKTQSALERI